MPKIILEDVKINRGKKTIKIEKTITRTKEPQTKTIEEKIITESRVKAREDFLMKNRGKNIDKEENTIVQPVETRKKRIFLTPRPSKIQNQNTLKYLGIIVFGLIVVFLSGNIFYSARVTITPKQENISFKNKIFNANKKEGVDFEIMIASLKKEKPIILTEAKEVSNKASGSIILFNEFSTKAQSIPSGTYISDQEGKTYRTDKAVSVPGYKKNGNKIIPGQTVVGITSFLAGENYNGTPEKFYINSFKGTTKYGKIYGKLKNPLVGGKQGLVYYLSEEDKQKIKEIAENSFKQDLFKQVQSLTPDKYILYEGATNFKYKYNEDILSESAETKIEIEGQLSAVLIKEDSFNENTIKQMLPDVKKEDVNKIKLSGINGLSFSFGNNSNEITKEMNNFSFVINGELLATWVPEQINIKKELSGLDKGLVNNVFRSNIGISKASVKIFPIWKNKMPLNPSKIYIKIKQ